MLIDTHSHLFLDEFSADLPQVIERAKAAGVSLILMPNIDSSTFTSLRSVCSTYSGYCYPLVGVHPTSVKENYEEELHAVYSHLSDPSFPIVGIGEIGIDLHWDRTFRGEQLKVFDCQIGWALEYNLPIVVHVRDAFADVFEVMAAYKGTTLRGIFHSFTGTADDAVQCLDFGGFMLGINGIVTFKNSSLPEILHATVPLERLVLETDSPYLAPVPNRGKRNESAYILSTLRKVSEIYGVTVSQVAQVTTENTLKVFPRLPIFHENPKTC